MNSIQYIREKLERFAVNADLEFHMSFNSGFQRWMLRFVNRKFKLGCDLLLSDEELSITCADNVAEWIIYQVKKSNIIIF